MQVAEIIAIGTELLTPDKTDTNSLWLTARLNEIGIEVMLKTVVGDDEERLEEAISDAVRRSDIVITTGGLGPTEDDITRQVSARAVGRKLIYHTDLESELRRRFRSFGREMPNINKRQAFVIEGADILPNPNGSAVGMMLVREDRTLIVLPGPPRELQPMFEDFVLPRLRASAGAMRIRRRHLRVVGMGESAVDEAISAIYTRHKNVRTSILFNKSEVEIHLAAASLDPAEADDLLDGIVSQIDERLGIALFARNGESMEQVVGDLLVAQSKTVAVAESCTGGLIAMRLTEVAGASHYFIEAAVTYSNESKIETLGVSADTLMRHGAVSAETAKAMARGMRKRAGTATALAVTGIAGPDGGSEQKPVGTVFVAFSDNAGEHAVKLMLLGDRYLIRWRASQAALDLLRRRLLLDSTGR